MIAGKTTFNKNNIIKVQRQTPLICRMMRMIFILTRGLTS